MLMYVFAWCREGINLICEMCVISNSKVMKEVTNAFTTPKKSETFPFKTEFIKGRLKSNDQLHGWALKIR